MKPDKMAMHWEGDEISGEYHIRSEKGLPKKRTL
jgi:hypothetical protein